MLDIQVITSSPSLWRDCNFYVRLGWGDCNRLLFNVMRCQFLKFAACIRRRHIIVSILEWMGGSRKAIWRAI